MTSLIYKQHNYKKSAHHKKNLLPHRVQNFHKFSLRSPWRPRRPKLEKQNGRSNSDWLSQSNNTTSLFLRANDRSEWIWNCPRNARNVQKQPKCKQRSWTKVKGQADGLWILLSATAPDYIRTFVSAANFNLGDFLNSSTAFPPTTPWRPSDPSGAQGRGTVEGSWSHKSSTRPAKCW